MSLLVDPSELAEWWTVIEVLLWLKLDPATLEQVAVAVCNDADDRTTVSDIWEKLDFCAQTTLMLGMERFDAECLPEPYFESD